MQDPVRDLINALDSRRRSASNLQEQSANFASSIASTFAQSIDRNANVALLRRQLADNRTSREQALRQQQAQEQALQEQQERIAQQVNRLSGAVADDAFGNLDADEREAFAPSAAGQFFIEQGLGEQVEAARSVFGRLDLSDQERERAQENLVAAEAALQQQQLNRQQTLGLDNAQFAQLARDNEFQELYENRNDSNLNPINALLNAGAGVVEGAAGFAGLLGSGVGQVAESGVDLAGLGASAIAGLLGADDQTRQGIQNVAGQIGDGVTLPFDLISQGIQGAGNFVGNLIDEENLDQVVQNQRIGQAAAQFNPRDVDGNLDLRQAVSSAGDVLSGSLDALNTGGVVNLLGDIAGIVATGGGIGAAGRAAGLTNAARQGTAAVARQLPAGATRQGFVNAANNTRALLPTTAAIQGQSFQQNAVDSAEGDRGAQALTQLAAIPALGIAGGIAPRFLGGIEGAIATRTLPRAGAAGARANGVLRNTAQGTAQRAVSAGVGGLRQGVSEGVQEGVETIIESGAGGVADPNETFLSAQDPGQIIAATGIGGALGLGVGGATGAVRQVDPNAVPPTPNDTNTQGEPPPVDGAGGQTVGQVTPQPTDRFNDTFHLGAVTPVSTINEQAPTNATDFNQQATDFTQQATDSTLSPIERTAATGSVTPDATVATALGAVPETTAANNTASQPQATVSDDVRVAARGVQTSAEAELRDGEAEGGDGLTDVEGLDINAGLNASTDQITSAATDAGVLPNEAATAVRQPTVEDRATPADFAPAGDAASVDANSVIDENDVDALVAEAQALDGGVDTTAAVQPDPDVLPRTQPLPLEVPTRVRRTPSGTFTNSTLRYGRLNAQGGVRTTTNREGVVVPTTTGRGQVALITEAGQVVPGIRGTSLPNLQENLETAIAEGTLSQEAADLIATASNSPGESTAATATVQPQSSLLGDNAIDGPLDLNPADAAQEAALEIAPQGSNRRVQARIDARRQRATLLNDNQNPVSVSDTRPEARVTSGLSAPVIRRQVARSVRGIANVTNVLSSTEISPELEARIRTDIGTGFADTKAIVYRDQLIINRDNIEDEVDLEVTLAHEILGHIGLRAQHGPRLESFLKELGDNLGGVDGIVQRGLEVGVDLQANYAPLIQRAGENQGDRNALVEELISGLAQRGGLTPSELSTLDRMGAAVARWLRNATPRLAEFLGVRGVTNVELAQFVSEASKAGRDVVDRGQGFDTVRAFANIDYSNVGRLTQSIRQFESAPDSFRGLARDIGNFTSELVQPGGVQRASRRLTERRRSVLREDNAYTRLKRRLVDNRERLQAVFNETNRRWNADGGQAALVSGVESLLGSANSSRLEGSSERKNLFAEALRNILRTDPNENLDNILLDTLATRVKELGNLNEAIRLRQSEAGEVYLRQTQVIRDDLQSAMSLLEKALGVQPDGTVRGVSQRTADVFFNSAIRNFHAIERNDSFYFNPTKNPRTLRQILGPDNFKVLRDLYNSQFVDGANETQIGRDVRAFVEANVLPAQLNEFQTTYAETRTIGLTSAEARRGLEDAGLLRDADNFNPDLLRAFDHSNLMFQRLIKAGDDIERDSGMGSVRFDRALRYNNFTYYYPHYSANNPDANKGDTDYMPQYRYADRFVNTFGVATGSTEQGVDALIAGNHQVERKYSAVGDNKIGERVALLWAASQDSASFRGTLGIDLSDVNVRILNKNSTRGNEDFNRVAGRHQPNVFLWHLPPGLQIPGRDVEGSTGNSDQYVAVIEFANDSEVPLQIKGRRERSQFLETLQRERPQTYNALRFPARTIGSFHTRYNFLNYPARALVRDGIQAFATVGAAEGLAGVRAFRDVGVPAAARDANLIAQYMWHRSQTGQASADRLAELDANPQLRDFVEFVQAGGYQANARSFSLEARHDELTSGLQGGRVLNRTQREGLAQVDQAITMASIMADALGRYATYKTYRHLGRTASQAALEAKQLANFEQRGESSFADIGSLLYTFFRPSIIGTTQIIDSLLDSQYGNEALAIGIGMSGALFALGMAMAGEDEEGNNRFLQQGSDPLNFRLFIGDDVALQIPYGYNAFTAVIGMGMQALFGTFTDQTPLDTLSNMFDVVTNNLSPVTNNIPITDDGRFSLRNATTKAFDLALPTFLGTGLGLAANMNNFGSPITDPPGAVFGTGTLGRVYNANTRQVGGLSEALTVGLFEQLGLPFDQRQVDYLFGELASGPRNVIDSAFEAYRIASGQDYTPNLKRLSLGVGGFIASPYDRNVGRYYDTLDRVRDITLNRRSLVRVGYSEDQAEELIRNSYGQEEYDRLIRFENLDDNRIRTLASEAKSTRLNRNLTAAERITRGREITDEQSRIIRQILDSIE